MSKRFISLNGLDFINMVLAGAGNLQKHADDINALNVFPVPDGDTGTNMNLTLTSGVEELKKKPSSHIGHAANVLAKGLLMGARGNSGVILSQLFRGFAKSVHDFEEINVHQFAAALQHGVDTAYKAVVKPVEGTILTVSKEAAKHAVAYARRYGDVLELMLDVLEKAKSALAKTPEQLPVLKQVGVVDAGGQGLVYIYEGFISALKGETNLVAGAVPSRTLPNVHPMAEKHQAKSAQAQLATEDIRNHYDMEFFIHMTPPTAKGKRFVEKWFRIELEKLGDSVIVIADDGLVKVHVHAKRPGDVLNLALPYGELSKINILNMRDQHRELLAAEPAQTSQTAVKSCGFVAVAMGEGMTNILISLGVDHVLSGGQTMNPSTEDIVNAIREVNSDVVYVLPNNSNIILAAQQAKHLVHKHIEVIPTKTIPQGIAAMLAFQEGQGTERNTEAMTNATKQVRSGQVTYAVRDSTIEGIQISEGDYLGIHENQIVAAGREIIGVCKNLLESMIGSGDEVLTIYTGTDAVQAHTDQLISLVKQVHPEIEIEVYAGDQPLYPYIFSVE